ncbi:circadian-associated transcriptional repressor isoform X2 [Lethenteron reissneri]|uniref:circadian-associated transcriptional repressor isoform X2 n=1 Tax=Lethenteron reissneri TaxID=7753 RepID=UPI002AB5E6C9|nr:circadian-associated transcriptional repressor isoform X2 [Lethenteron reissneri]
MERQAMDNAGETETRERGPAPASGPSQVPGCAASLRARPRDGRDGGRRPGGSAGPSGLVKEGAEATSAGSEQVDALFARKCKELEGFIKPLTAILNGLKNGRYGKGLSGLQQNVAIDRIQRIVGVLENPGMGGKYLATLQQVEMMLKAWFPKVKPQPSTSAERMQSNAALAFVTAQDPPQDHSEDSTIDLKGMPPTSITWTHVAPIACPALGEKASYATSTGGIAHSATGSHVPPDSGAQFRRCCSLPASLGSAESSPRTSQGISPSHASASPSSADVFVPLNHRPVADCAHPQDGRKGTRSPSSKARDLAAPREFWAEQAPAAAATAEAAAGQDAVGRHSLPRFSQQREREASHTRRAPAPSDWFSLNSCYQAAAVAAEEDAGTSSRMENERAGGMHGGVNRKRRPTESVAPGTLVVPRLKMARQKCEIPSPPHERGHNI